MTPDRSTDPRQTSLLPQDTLGAIDIYLFDQIQRGRIRTGMRVLDVGCGSGRNIAFLMDAGLDVYASDSDPAAIDAVRRLAARVAPALPDDHFRVESMEVASFPAASMDVVIASAVWHFARDHAHFDAMVHGAWRALEEQGLLFARLASSIGIEAAIEPLGQGRFHLPDGSDRYLVDRPRLVALAETLGGRFADPLKTTIVDGQRAMTTLVLVKSGAGPRAGT